MRQESKSQKPLYLRPVIHLLSWVALIFFILVLANSNYSDIRELPLFFSIVLFYLNFSFFVPKFLFQKKQKEYFFLIVVALLLNIFLLEIIRKPHPPARNQPHTSEQNSSKHRPLRPPPPRIDSPPFRPERTPEENWGPSREEAISKHLIVFFLVISLSSAIRIAFKWDEKEAQLRELEKERLHAELSFLKNQISPHFFFNVLNTIYVLTDLNPKCAQEAILKLSGMMRYLLYESEMGEVSLSRELELLTDYIELMKLRLSEQVEIRLELPKKLPPLKISPLLFLPFVENAFKHGISFHQKSFIHLRLELSGSTVHFSLENSKIVQKKTEMESENISFQEGGIGLQNIKKRLDLLYPEHYCLTVSDEAGRYRVELQIQLME